MFLLLNPYLRSSNTVSEKPIVVIAQDNSASIASGLKDSVAYKNALSELEKSG